VSTHATPGPDPQVVALTRATERTARRVDEVETLVRQLAADVAAHARAAGGAGVDEPDEPARVRAWLAAADPDLAATDLAGLVAWVEAVYLRYEGAFLPSCWLWHPDAVEELLWLRGAHREAYGPRGASWARAADWHDRYRPGVVARLKTAIGHCELARHTPDGDRAHRQPLAPLSGATNAISHAWATDRVTPEPTHEHLRKAHEHDRAQNDH
jgi:hypothetical protein